MTRLHSYTCHVCGFRWTTLFGEPPPDVLVVKHGKHTIRVWGFEHKEYCPGILIRDDLYKEERE
jgi:hypothetical protein